jgi:hopanoid biosynthesis associated RND transporter like protein HpnN
LAAIVELASESFMPTESSDRHVTAFNEFLRSWTRLIAARPWASLLLLLIVCVACGVYTSRTLKFKNGRDDLIDPQADFHKRWLKYTQSFGESSDIVIVVEGRMPDDIIPVLDDLGERLKEDDQHFRDVLYRIEHDQLRRKGMQFLSAEQLEMCLAQLREMRPVIQGDYDTVNLERVISQLLHRLNLLRFTAAAVAGRDDSKLPGPSNSQVIQLISQHVISLATSMTAALKNPEDTRNPWPQLVQVDGDMSAAAMKPTYFLNDRGTQGFLQVVAIADKSDFNGATAVIKRLRDIIADVRPDHPHVRIGLTGIPVLENDENLRSQRDMTLSTIVSAVGVLLLLLAGFHGYRHPLLAMVMLAAGLLWSCAYATAVVGHLTILSAAFAAILMGLGIDFAIVYLSRYLELRHEGQSLDDALGNTSASIGASIFTASITTALAFYCATFTKFLGVAELGMIAGGGVFLCALSAFFVLPPLLRLADRNVAPAQLPTPIQGNSLRWATRRYPWFVAISGLLLMVGIGAQAIHWNGGRPSFAIAYDHNLLNLQAKGVESVDLQNRMFRESKSSLLFAVALADSAEDARRLKKQFEDLPTVRKVEELGSHLPSTNLAEVRLLIQAAHAEVANLAPVSYEPREVNPEALGRLIERLHGALDRHEESWAKKAAGSLDEFLDRFESLPLERQVRFLNEFQGRMNLALHAQLQALAEASDSEPITLADFPKELVSRYVSPEGKWQLQIFPKEQIWDISPLREFVEDVRSIDPEVTGTPLQNYEASWQIMKSYQDAAAYAFVAICLTLLLDLLGREQAVRVLVPPALLLAVVVGMCRWLRIDVRWELLSGLYLAMVVTIASLVDSSAVFYAMLALLPPMGGAAIMFGIMRLMRVDLNPANLIVLPLLLGIGVDGGVHVIHDFRWQTKRRYRISSSIINSLVLTSTTTMVGFGSMLLAAHRGLYTFGLVLTIGVASCVFMSLVPLPAILTLLDRRRRAEMLRRFRYATSPAPASRGSAQSIRGPASFPVAIPKS